jgi:hypothetical protein
VAVEMLTVSQGLISGGKKSMTYSDLLGGFFQRRDHRQDQTEERQRL